MSASRLRIGFVDFWKDFEPEHNFIIDALETFTSVKVVKRNPHVLFYAPFGTKNFGFVGKKILVNPEIHSQFHGRPDFSISYHESSVPNRLRLPVWAWQPSPSLLIPASERGPDLGSRFCTFIANNPNSEFRNRFVSALDARKSVDSLGAVFRSAEPVFDVGDRFATDWRTRKLETLSNFRFTIAFESSGEPGYSTEKIADPLIAGSVPIYWGDPFIAEDFNPDAFIDIRNFRNYREAIDFIVDLDTDHSAIQHYRSQAPMAPHQYERYFGNRFQQFLKMCVDSSGPSLVRRCKRAAWGQLNKVWKPDFLG